MPIIYRTRRLAKDEFERLPTELWLQMTRNAFIWEDEDHEVYPEAEVILWLHENTTGLFHIAEDDDDDDDSKLFYFENEEDAAAFVLRWATET